jgi:nucleotide-binding universal stress UspA family protein
LPYAESLARATRGSLRLIRTTPSNTPTDYIERALEGIARRAYQVGVSADWRVVEGPATPAILDAARSWPADIIALATSKWSGLDRWLNASVADAVVRSADRPVLVVPPEWQPPAARRRPEHILVPLDGSPLAEQALALAARLAGALGADLILLRVIDAGPDQGQALDRAPSEDGGAETYLQRLAAQVGTSLPDRQVVTRVISGSPAAAIAQAALDLQVDVIAMSTRGRSGLARAVLGSTATATLEQSTVPLLLLGPHALT